MTMRVTGVLGERERQQMHQDPLGHHLVGIEYRETACSK